MKPLGMQALSQHDQRANIQPLFAPIDVTLSMSPTEKLSSDQSSTPDRKGDTYECGLTASPEPTAPLD
jgi:hypothetical protein